MLIHLNVIQLHRMVFNE